MQVAPGLQSDEPEQVHVPAELHCEVAVHDTPTLAPPSGFSSLSVPLLGQFESVVHVDPVRRQVPAFVPPVGFWQALPLQSAFVAQLRWGAAMAATQSFPLAMVEQPPRPPSAALHWLPLAQSEFDAHWLVP